MGQIGCVCWVWESASSHTHTALLLWVKSKMGINTWLDTIYFICCQILHYIYIFFCLSNELVTLNDVLTAVFKPIIHFCFRGEQSKGSSCTPDAQIWTEMSVQVCRIKLRRFKTCWDHFNNLVRWIPGLGGGSSLHHILTRTEPHVGDGKRSVAPNMRQCAEAEVTSIWALILHQFHEIATFFFFLWASPTFIQTVQAPRTHTHMHAHIHTFISPQLLGSSRGLVAHTNGSYFRWEWLRLYCPQ